MPWHIMEKEGLVDAFDGLGDLKRGQIRCVGDPRERFTEDALCVSYGQSVFPPSWTFEIEAETKAALAEFAAASYGRSAPSASRWS